MHACIAITRACATSEKETHLWMLISCTTSSMNTYPRNETAQNHLQHGTSKTWALAFWFFPVKVLLIWQKKRNERKRQIVLHKRQIYETCGTYKTIYLYDIYVPVSRSCIKDETPPCMPTDKVLACGEGLVPGKARRCNVSQKHFANAHDGAPQCP